MKPTLVLLLSLTFATSRAGAADEPRDSLPTRTRSPLLKSVDASIGRGVKYLLARQNPDGAWDDSIDYPVGETALVTLALLSCGEEAQSPAIKKALDFLRAGKTNKTYDLALRACVFAQLPDAIRGTQLKVDLAALLKNIKQRGPDEGMYGYHPGGEREGDFSNSQYGVLGVWYAQQAGMEVERRYRARVEAGWRRGQNDDGGWGYRTGMRGTTYSSMTAAGAATLYITDDYLHAADAHDLTVPAHNAPLEAAVRWLGDHFAVDSNTGVDSMWHPVGRHHRDDDIDDRRDPDRRSRTWIYYMLFGFERVGEASGLTRFGSHRWFEEGAKFLLEEQAYDGSWDEPEPLPTGPLCNTSYALLFFSRGRSPVAMQKLQFGNRWNNRPLDVHNFVHFMRHATERHTNWQVVSADAPLEDFRDAPMLYAASDRELDLTDEQRDRLATYVHEGGLLVFVNEGEGDRFTKSVQAVCKQIWPGYAFRELPEDHPVRKGNFPLANWTSPIQGLSNGVRELAILFPSGDASWKWQANGGALTANLSPFAPLANLSLYLSDKTVPRYKGETTWIERDRSARDADTRLLLARLRYAGNWDPEPLGWKRLSNLMHNAQDVELEPSTISIRPSELKIVFPIAHLTSVGSFQLAPAEEDALKIYLDKGGLLLFDAAGGNAEASLSFEALMARLYPNVKSAPLPVDHAIYSGTIPGGRKMDIFHYRRGASSGLPPTTLPRLRAYTIDGRIAVIQSNEDLSAALVGYTTGGITGYTPPTATMLMRNLVLWAAGRNR